MFNLVPQDNGLIEVSIPGIENFSNIVIVACDKYSVVKRMVDVTKLLNAKEA